jgi:hypothetical protein
LKLTVPSGTFVALQLRRLWHETRLLLLAAALLIEQPGCLYFLDVLIGAALQQLQLLLLCLSHQAWYYVHRRQAAGCENFVNLI